MEAREVLFRILLGHRLVGHDAKNPIEKICECGQRFVGLLAQDEHQRVEQEKIVAELLLPAASPDALRVPWLYAPNTQIQWNGPCDGIESVCPACGKSEREGHNQVCRIAAALSRAKVSRRGGPS